MLDIMRRKKRLKLVLWLVIISLGMGMLLLFVPGQNIGIQGFDDSVASVAGDGISMKEFTDVYHRVVENYSNGGKNKTDADTLKRMGLDKQALNALIQVRVVAYAAKRLGLDVTPEEVRHSIETNPNLRNQQGFIGVEAYKALLEANRMDVEEFESGIRNLLLTRKISNLITDSIDVPEKQLRESFARQSQEATVQYVLFDKEAAKKKVSPTEAELRAYFEANKDKYSLKEERRAQYLAFSFSDIASTIKVTEQEIDEAWNRRDHSETVTASHILFKVDDPSKEAEVKAKAEEILKRAKGGENFSDLAGKYSQDEASARQGGSLGAFSRGRMAKEFEDAAFALKPGEISGLVKTQFGYHIIKLLARDIPNKEALRANLIRAVQVDKAVDIAKGKAAEALKLMQTQKDLAAVAKTLSVPAQIKESPFFNRGTDPYAIGLSQEFIDEVFRLKEINSFVDKVVDLPAGVAIAKLDQINSPKPPEFTQAQEAVKKDYIEAKALELIQTQAKKLGDEAKSQGGLALAAQKAGLPVKTSQSFRRDGEPDKEIGSAPGFTAAAFSLSVGGISSPITLGGGKQVAVLQVKSLTPFSEVEFAKQKYTLREGVLVSLTGAYFDEYIRKVTDDLNKGRQIRINTSVLDQFTGNRY